VEQPTGTDQHTPPTTTAEQQRVTAGQRSVNLIWEFTQALIAIAVTVALVWCVVQDKNSQVLSNAFTLIISIYFVRTNHTKMGGIPSQQRRD
jgi:hypothetical protein